MAQTSPVLALPFIQGAQAQKHVTHNEALRILDAIVQLAVADWQQDTPPVSPAVGARYVVPAAGQGDWSGHDTHIAVFMDGYWFFVAPQAGWSAQVTTGGAQITFDGVEWRKGGFENLSGLGVNTTSDVMNRLSVASEATLLNHDGAGHQLKLNKSAAGDTASVLFQTGYGGRAEMGTAGDDDFAIKVSADGATWAQAMVIDGDTGAVRLPNTAQRRVLDAPLTLYVDPVAGDDANAGDAAGTGAFATLEHAVAVGMGVDGNGHDVLVDLADGTHTLASPLVFSYRALGHSGLRFRGNTSDPTQVRITSPREVFDVRCGRIYLEGVCLENSSSNAPVLMVAEEGFCTFEAVDFGTAGGHIYINGGSVSVTGDYSISGDADYHLRLTYGALLRCVNSAVTLEGPRDFRLGYITLLSVSVAKLVGCSFVGAATGRRYLASYNSVLDTNGGGADFFPGDAAGNAPHGSIYR